MENTVSDNANNFLIDKVLTDFVRFLARYSVLLIIGVFVGVALGAYIVVVRPPSYEGLVEVRMAGYSSASNVGALTPIQDAQQSLIRLSYGSSFSQDVVLACGASTDGDPEKLAANLVQHSSVVRPEVLRIEILLKDHQKVSPCLEGVVKSLASWQTELLKRRLEPVNAKIAEIRQEILDARKGSGEGAAGNGIQPADQSVPAGLLAALTSIQTAYSVVWDMEVVQPVTVRQQDASQLIIKLIFGGGMAGFSLAMLTAILLSIFRRPKLS